MKKILALMMIMSLILVSCGGGENTSTTSQNAEDKVEVAQDLRVTLNGITNTMDVNIANYTNTSTIMYQVLSNLIYFDETFSMKPEVLTSWDQLDENTYELVINPDYMFHNGEPVTVEDVQYSILRLADIPQTASSVENIKDITIVDDKTLKMVTINPENNTMRGMANIVVVPKKLVEEQGDKYWEHPVGSGPFEFVSFVPGQEVVIKKWDDYPFEKAKLDSITFKNIEDATSLYIALETGETDFINKVQYLDQPRAEEHEDIKIQKVETVNTGFIAMNASKAPFDNELIRRAVAFATDKESMALLSGDAVVIDSMVPHFVEGYHSADTVPVYDVEKAKALLKEAGYENLSITCSAYSSDTARIELLQADLKKVGIEMNIEILEFGVFLDKVINQDYELLFGSWGNTNGDVASMLDCYTESSWGESNIAFYLDPEMDRLHKLAVETLDHDEKIEALKDIQELAGQACSMVPTTSGLTCYGMKKNLHGVGFIPSGILDFSKAYLE
ncbi:hypothetical protein EZV73_05705 [Acidaminobacter sp. JC074]|uniref:ABC transporter substrate-binding protein n=1 Tax=Acidaminobacter sp. JC074 TaxID=2530199 RepID=UPI001F0EADB1|nr:ABC transporter substrate-binding protein [Acidaminobacter sp. JC074]MCH4887053.1 hypothetical protein [Acidaminobacter sp. JC074]